MKESANNFLILAVIGMAITNIVVIYKLNAISNTIDDTVTRYSGTVNDISEILRKVKLLIP